MREGQHYANNIEVNQKIASQGLGVVNGDVFLAADHALKCSSQPSSDFISRLLNWSGKTKNTKGVPNSACKQNISEIFPAVYLIATSWQPSCSLLSPHLAQPLYTFSIKKNTVKRKQEATEVIKTQQQQKWNRKVVQSALPRTRTAPKAAERCRHTCSEN